MLDFAEHAPPAGGVCMDADTWRPVRSAFIRARFGGTCFYRLACDECKKAAESSSKSHAFLALDLTVCSTLEQALRKYRAAKEIGYRCEHCPCAVGLRHIEIRELPLVLCLQFKRYRFAMSGTTTKLDGAITFPEFLDETIEAVGEVDGKCEQQESQEADPRASDPRHPPAGCQQGHTHRQGVLRAQLCV